MPRVIAGTAGGRRIAAPPGTRTRPTADRVKEAMFSSLGEMGALVVLDLFAGSGALGIEALSRGAAAAVLVERDRRAAAVIEDNLRRAGVTERGHVRQMDAGRFCQAPADHSPAQAFPVDLVLIDPPYAVGHDEIARLVGQLQDHGALRSRARLVLERDRTAGQELLPGMISQRLRRYGDTTLHYHRAP